MKKLIQLTSSGRGNEPVRLLVDHIVALVPQRPDTTGHVGTLVICTSNLQPEGWRVQESPDEVTARIALASSDGMPVTALQFTEVMNDPFVTLYVNNVLTMVNRNLPAAKWKVIKDDLELTLRNIVTADAVKDRINLITRTKNIFIVATITD